MTGKSEKSSRLAVVTGAAQGIGLASARAFCEAGFRAVLIDVNQGKVEAAADDLRQNGHEATAVVCDVAVSREVETALAAIHRDHGSVGALHANAAVSKYEPLETMPVAEIERQIGINLVGALLCARATIPLMEPGGSIVFTTSVQAYITLAGCVPYAAAKAGLLAAARALAVEVGARGIRVNCVSPGTIDTPMLREGLDDMNQNEVEDFFNSVRAANALGRIGDARDIANAVVFLCSPQASYVTGTDLIVDGGYLRLKKF